MTRLGITCNDVIIDVSSASSESPFLPVRADVSLTRLVEVSGRERERDYERIGKVYSRYRNQQASTLGV